jgi:hypothetical protein
MTENGNSIDKPMKPRKAYIAKICFVLFIVLLVFIAITPTYRRLHDFNARLVCERNLSELSKAIHSYYRDHSNSFPFHNWCDCLIEYDYDTEIENQISVKTFICPGSDAKKGECSYALNKYIVDSNTNFETLPERVVVLFETDFGREPDGLWRSVNKKLFSTYQLVKENGKCKIIRNNRLDKFRWNQIGGSEIVTTAHHGGNGFHVVYADGIVEFITPNEISNLRWKP